ncbi:hypothetical protein M413DRAFT_448206 [Hebeloma cylindrosporum]|uniref:RRM domain-containing protein n=1 Tax=Hebeloma cylindrosporum TaxID=76867 RepID=A0A0C3BMN2_HEBCY|nr:hypothetical protein M413DRAFT_448206 [Hebeloma cylindrosporum h7]
MSKATLDSDLYGDIYEEVEDLDNSPSDEQEATEATENADQYQIDIDDESYPVEDEVATTTSSQQESSSSLPSKPAGNPSSDPSPQLSYSAQVAKQFSAYQQTPSQERQQRKEIPLPPNPRASARTNSFTSASGSEAPKTYHTSGGTVFGKKPSEMHDHGKLFIGGLSWDTTDEGLRDYFAQFGQVDACTIMRDPAGTSRGFAFMTFEDASAVNLVVSREHQLDGKMIDPKRAIPREEHLRNTRYFVGGLSPVTTPDSMRQFFGEYGKVVDATVMLDRESGRSKGFGFVTFEDANNAGQLVGNVGLILDDKQIEVKAAQPRSQRVQGRTSTSHPNSNAFDPIEQQQQTPSPAMNFVPNVQQLPLSMLYQQAQLPLGMLNMNPMMGLGMNNFLMGQGMPTPLGMMGAGLDMTSPFTNMGNMGAIRLGHGPIGGGMGVRNNFVAHNGGGAPGIGGTRSVTNHQHVGRTVGNSGSGPTRTVMRGQHSFHPYAR